MPPLPQDWSPATTRAGALDEVVQRLARFRTVLVFSDDAGDARTRRIEALSRLAPDADVRDAGALVDAYAERLPASIEVGERLVLERGAPLSDALGPQLDETTIAVALHRSQIDEAVWRARPSARHAGCEPIYAALGLAQEDGLLQIARFTEHLDRTLRVAYRRALNDRRAEVMRALAVQEVDGDCADELNRARESVETCLAEGECADAPRGFLQSKVRVGADPPHLARCDGPRRDASTAALAAVNRESVGVAVRYVQPEWASLAARVAALGEVYAAMDEACAPRRRRYVPASLEAFQAELELIREGYRLTESVPGDAGWVVATGEPRSFHVPGVGQVDELARFETGTGSAARAILDRAHRLRERILAEARCRGDSGSPPLVLGLIERPTGGSPTLVYDTHVYDETLACEGLPPVAAPLAAEPSRG
jgi:hypothetical protein